MKNKRTGILMLALIMVLTMAANAFAASGAAESDSTDYITDRTGNSTAVRQENSSETGTIRLGKILTVNQPGKFPNIEDFVFSITPVAAWENANKSTSKSGSSIPQSEMPAPNASNIAHHSIVSPGGNVLRASSWTAQVSIGNFKNASEDNTSGIYGDSAHKYINSDNESNSDYINENMRRTRVTDVSFTFSKAGYYMYKVEELGSKENSSSDIRNDVSGVDYDKNSYYVVFYVCNKEAIQSVEINEYGQGTHEGDTVEGVYVHSITSWTNQPEDPEAGKEATDYKPDNTMRTSDDLADAQNWLHDLMESEDVDSRYSTEYGDGGHPADLNTGRVDNNNAGTVTHDNLGKVGISTPEEPNYLEAYRMWNGQITHDVVLKKSVTGNLGDLTKEFVFEVTLTGLEGNQKYTSDEPAITTDDATSAGVKMYDMTPASCLSADGKSFTTDSTGAVTFKVKLKDGEILVLNALPMSASYQIKEQASDHVAQYNIVSTNKGDDGPGVLLLKASPSGGLPVFTETGYTPGGNDAGYLGKANKDANTELSTEIEFVDRYDETVTVIFRNNRDLATITGISGIDYVVYAASLAILAMIAAVIIKRRREYAREEDILA